MKKILMCLLGAGLVLPVAAQKLNFAKNLEYGFRLAPQLSFTQVDAAGFAYADAKSTGVGVRGSVGVFADYFVWRKVIPVAVSTGIWYTARAANAIPGENYNGLYSKGRYNLGYIQIPLSAKVYIYKPTRNTYLYLQPGITADIKISEKPRDDQYNYFYRLTTGFTQESLGKSVYKPFNFGPYLGVGIEKTVDQHLKLFGSLSISRGVLQILNDIQDKKSNGELVFVNKDLHVKTSQVAFEVGVKF